MKDRIKEIRAKLKMSQQSFSDVIGITRQYLSLLEIGERDPSDLVLNAICHEFGINRTWLKTGEGEMFKHQEADALIPALRNVLAEYPAIAKALGQAMSVMTSKDFARLHEIMDLCTAKKEQP